MNAPPPLQRFGPAVIIHGAPLDELLRLALLGAQARRQRDGIETPAGTLALLQTLADAAREGGMSPPRHDDVATDPDERLWEPLEGIDAREVASMLVISVRQAQRLATDLGARRIGKSLVYDRGAVLAFAAQREEDAR